MSPHDCARDYSFISTLGLGRGSLNSTPSVERVIIDERRSMSGSCPVECESRGVVFARLYRSRSCRLGVEDLEHRDWPRVGVGHEHAGGGQTQVRALSILLRPAALGTLGRWDRLSTVAWGRGAWARTQGPSLSGAGICRGSSPPCCSGDVGEGSRRDADDLRRPTMKLALDDPKIESRSSSTLRQRLSIAAGSFADRSTPRQAVATASEKVCTRLDLEIFGVAELQPSVNSDRESQRLRPPRSWASADDDGVSLR